MMKTESTESFMCQRCHQPLILDNGFGNISVDDLSEYLMPISATANKEIKLNSQGTGLMTDGIDSQNLKARADLFDCLLNNSEVEDPLCNECTDSLVDLMDHQLEITGNECKDYNNYLEDVEEIEPNIELLEKELNVLEDEERRLIEELKIVECEDEAVRASIHSAETERDRLDEKREKFYCEYRKKNQYLMLTEDEYRSLDCQLAYVNSRLDKLKNTNFFNVTFHICQAGPIGTINSFRLGRLPSMPVAWSEINAAWGQAALLLSALASKMDLIFKKYRLVPFGNHSYIEVIGERKELPLYGSGNFTFFSDTKFDAAMFAFLDCLTQFKEKLERNGGNLPYQMKKGEIKDSTTGISYSIKIRLNSEENWTKALKFLLTNLEWSMTWVAASTMK